MLKALIFLLLLIIIKTLMKHFLLLSKLKTVVQPNIYVFNIEHKKHNISYIYINEINLMNFD